MWRELGLIVAGGLIGFFGNMLIMAYTVNRKMDQILLRMPDLVTAAALEERLKNERHGMRGELQAYGASMESDLDEKVRMVDGRVGVVETRLRIVELTVASRLPKREDPL